MSSQIEKEIIKLKEIIDEEGFKDAIENYSESLAKLCPEFKVSLLAYKAAEHDLRQYLGV